MNIFSNMLLAETMAEIQWEEVSSSTFKKRHYVFPQDQSKADMKMMGCRSTAHWAKMKKRLDKLNDGARVTSSTDHVVPRYMDSSSSESDEATSDDGTDTQVSTSYAKEASPSYTKEASQQDEDLEYDSESDGEQDVRSNLQSVEGSQNTKYESQA